MALLFWVSFTLFLIYIFHQYSNFRENILRAKRSGFLYHLAPFSFQQPIWLASQNILAPLFQRLPAAISKSWLPFSLLDRIWSEGFAPFAHRQADNVLLVSPSSNVLYTCDPQVISQITSRRRDFLKPMSLLKMLNIYGPTLSGSEGEEARLYRMTTTPAFNERTHQQVWAESLRQTGDMLTLTALDRAPGSVHNLSERMAKLALNVISKVCFGKAMKWQDEQDGVEKVPRGHEFTYAQAINKAVESNTTLFLTPKLVLNISPLKIHKKANKAFNEWRRYMLETRDETKRRLKGTAVPEQPSLLEALVQAGEPSPGAHKADLLAPEAVLGNMHLFLLAGHETSANTTAIAFSLLAFHPAIQATLQQELDDIFSGRDPESASWSFEKDYPRLVNGYVGALLNETLRLYPTLPLISKCTGDMPQEIVTEARTFVVPADTLVVVNIAATHRNPRYWPGDADAFDPTRWLGKDSAGPDAFLPFSNGYRACLGKRFAQIEFCAVVARVFSQYSVMLADDACNGGDVGALGALDSHVSFGMTLKLREDFPLRFVRRSGLSL